MTDSDYWNITSTKASFIKDMIMLVLYSLVFIFLTFIFYKVNKIQEKSHRCIINLMLVCLLLAVISKFFFTLMIISLIFLGTLTFHSIEIWAHFSESVTIREWNIYVTLRNIFA